MKKSSIIFVSIIALLLLAGGIAVAQFGYVNLFNAEYGTNAGFLTNELGSCITCHTSATSPGARNSFGNDYGRLGFGPDLERQPAYDIPYSPTNGTTSAGDNLYRSSVGSL